MADRTEQDIIQFFKGREAALKLFRVLRQVIEGICSPTINVSKTQISFGEHYKYIWVWLPQIWVSKRAENSITVTILTGEKIKSEKIAESVQPKTGYWTHHIVINHKKDLDKKFGDLIKKSYAFYLKRWHEKQQRTKNKSASDSV